MIPLASAVAGAALFLGFVISVVNAFMPFLPHWGGASLVWFAGLILFFDLKKLQRNTILLISLLACLSWLVAWSVGKFDEIVDAMSVNQAMIVMLVGVQFLQLVALPVSDDQETLPMGKRAFLKTYLGVHFFGSVINLSAVLLVADRWVRDAPLLKNQQKLLTRAFTSAASWSPFFAAFAAAFVFTPDASLSLVISVGLIMTIIAFLVTWLEVLKDKKNDITKFIGYPVHFDALWLPVVLVIFVFFAHYFFPSIKVIILIAICALLVSVSVLLARRGMDEGLDQFKDHVLIKLPQMKNELTLFLIAGALGGGIAAAMEGLAITIPVDHFDGFVASGIMFFILILAIIGIHPVISIAVLGHWMVDLQANQSLLAMMFLMSWAIGVASSPISGVNLALQGRYGVSGLAIFRWNLAYAIKMYLVASILLIMSGHLLGV